MHSVYRLVNTFNGKVYIGMTSKSPEVRWDEHLYEAQCRNASEKLKRAIRKYGERAWVLETLHHCPTREAANEKEIEEISAHRSTDDRYGYNMTSGGEGGNGFHCWPRERQEEFRTLQSHKKRGTSPRAPRDPARKARRQSEAMGRFFKRLSPEERALRATKKCGAYLVVDYGDRQVYRTNRLKAFCLEHEITYTTAIQQANSKCSSLIKKRWLVFRDEGENDERIILSADALINRL